MMVGGKKKAVKDIGLSSSKWIRLRSRGLEDMGSSPTGSDILEFVKITEPLIQVFNSHHNFEPISHHFTLRMLTPFLQDVKYKTCAEGALRASIWIYDSEWFHSIILNCIPTCTISVPYSIRRVQIIRSRRAHNTGFRLQSCNRSATINGWGE